MKQNIILLISRKVVFVALFAVSLIGSETSIQVFQPPSSSCPKSWFTDMEEIVDKVHVITLISVKNLKKDIGIPREIQSCNTSLMGDYVFEGNVPLQAIKDFLKRKPLNTIGLALPAYENDKKVKTVYLINEGGTYKEFGKY